MKVASDFLVEIPLLKDNDPITRARHSYAMTCSGSSTSMTGRRGSWD